MNINAIFEELAATPGKNDKLAILKANKYNDLFKEVCRLALDPFTVFYIKKIPTYTSNLHRRGYDLAWAIRELQSLSDRTYTGNAAIAHLTNVLGQLSTDDAKVIERIIAKDLKCGVDTAVNKVWPGLVMDYPCLLASSQDQKIIDNFSYPAYVQLKLDGMRFNAIVKNGQCEFRSRQGQEIFCADPAFGEMFITLSDGDDLVFDGELLCRNADGTVMDRATGNGIINKGKKGTQSLAQGRSVCAVVWDLIPYSEFSAGRSDVPYSIRLSELQERIALNPAQFRVQVVATETVQSLDEAQDIFQKFLSEGQEGIILKNPNMKWSDTRSKDQVKFKDWKDCDLIVTGWIEGKGKYVGMLGKLLCESSDGKIKVDVGGSDKDTKILTDEFRRTTKPEDIIGKIVTVKYNARIKDKRRPEYDSLFLPGLVEVREDKTVADHSSKIK